jgi:hypothetical protein
VAIIASGGAAGIASQLESKNAMGESDAIRISPSPNGPAQQLGRLISWFLAKIFLDFKSSPLLSSPFPVEIVCSQDPR